MKAPASRRESLLLWSRKGVIALALAGTATGCSRQGAEETGRSESNAHKVIVTRIAPDVSVFNPQGEPWELALPAEEWARQAVMTAKVLHLADPQSQTPSPLKRGGPLRLAARVGADRATGTLHAVVSVRLPVAGALPLQAGINASRPLPTVAADSGPAGNRPDGSVVGSWKAEDYRSHLRQAVTEVVAALDEQARLVVASNDGLISALKHDEPDVRVMAARRLAERKAQNAVGPLCALLNREKNEVGAAAVGSLAALGHQKAVPCLIEWAGSDLRRLVVAMEPLAALGGGEAQSFLEMIASGHDDPRIRRSAEAALKRMGGNSASGTQRAGQTR